MMTKRCRQLQCGDCMNECKVKVAIDGIDEAQVEIEQLREELDTLKCEALKLQLLLSKLELVIQTPTDSKE